MRWRGRQRSSNVEDRRSGRTMRRTKRTGGSLGIGAIIFIVIAMILGENPMSLLQNMSLGGNNSFQQNQNYYPPQNATNDEMKNFVEVVLKETEDVWNRIFPEKFGKAYQEPKLVLFTGTDRSACGFASAATGPFYCPADQKIYIDLSFFDELHTKFGAPGDFAMAYVIAHEVAHHVQYQLGITRQVDAQRGRISKKELNALSVRLELQADFFAGVWANHTQRFTGILEEGDIQEALRAANAIGDDRIQKQSRGYVVPDSFTHGTSEQRMRWFKKGYQTGDVSQGDTFNTRNL